MANKAPKNVAQIRLGFWLLPCLTLLGLLGQEELGVELGHLMLMELESARAAADWTLAHKARLETEGMGTCEREGLE